MIYGIGIDSVEISRFETMRHFDRFLDTWYTERERSWIGKNPRRAADNFAAKEAVAKITGRGFSGISPEEIEVLRDEAGAPVVYLHGRAKELFFNLNITDVHISITNTRTTAQAFAVGECRTGGMV